jgi:hypothetical protein
MPPDDNQALILQVSADVRRLEKQMAKAEGVVDKGSRNMEQRAKTASDKLERFFGKTDPAKALDKVFDATRFKVLDSGIAKVGLMGSALESLGVYGLAAAAAVGALAASFAQAREAARFADEIADTADRLHVTTDALQEYRSAIHAAGGEEKGADEALEGFSETLGKAQAGLGKAQRAFLELGFTKAQIKGFQDTDEALRAVTERIAKLPSQQRDAVISQLGLTGLKQLIDGGVSSMDQLRGKAHAAGVVMDSDLVRRGSELNDEIEEAQKRVEVQLHSAFVGLAPAILASVKLMGDLLEKAVQVVDVFSSIQNKRTEHLKDLRQQFVERQATPIGRALYGANDRKQIAALTTEIGVREARDKPSALKPTGALIDPTKTPKTASGPRDDTAQRTESVNAALAAAARDLLQAQGKLTDDIDARAEVERKIAAEELNQDLARLEKQKADVDSDKGISAATRASLKAKLDEAEVSARKAAEAKVDLIAREQDWALEDRADETRRRIRDAEIAQLEIAASLASTTEQRRAIELQILKIKQDELTHELGKSLSRQQQTGAITDEEGAKRFQAGTSGFAAERRQTLANTRGAFESFVAANAGAEKFKQTLEEIGVNGFQSLSDSLAQAIVNAEDLGDVAKNVFRQIAAQILSSAISNAGANVGAALIHLIPGFAVGTSSAPGGLALVGEKGPELVNLPKGAQVTPHSQTLQALKSMGVPSISNVSVHQTLQFDMRYGISTPELLADVNRKISASEQRAAQTGRQLARGDLAKIQYSRDLNG